MFFTICYSSDGGKISLTKSEYTTIELKDTEITTATVCKEDTKKDMETLFIDPISKDGYLVQKFRERNTGLTAGIFKVYIFIQGEAWITYCV